MGCWRPDDSSRPSQREAELTGVRIGLERRFHVPAFARAHVREFLRDRTATATMEQLLASGEFDRERMARPVVLPCEAVEWLNTHAGSWKFLERKQFAETMGEVVYDHVVLFRSSTMARLFEQAWRGFLLDRKIDGYQREIADLHASANLTFEYLKNAPPELRLKRARDLVHIERQVRQVEGQLRQFIAEVESNRPD